VSNNISSDSNDSDNTKQSKNKPQSKSSKEDECIEILKDYSYEIDEYTHPTSGKQKKNYICTHGGCKRAFSIIWNLLDHARMHKGIKPHQCDQCGKSNPFFVDLKFTIYV
jgi:hypothetical protein